MDLVRRLQAHPGRWALTAGCAVVIGAIAFVNMLPDFFERNLPWLQKRLPGVSVNVQQAVAAVVVLAALTLLVLIWRNMRNYSGTVTPPASQESEDLREELALFRATAKDAQEAVNRERRKVTTVLEKLQKVEAELSAVRRGETNSPLALVVRQPTVDEIKERADWILAHPTFGRDFFQQIAPFGPHDAWTQAERELKAERLGSSAPVISEAASVNGKPTRSAIEERALLLQGAAHHFAPLLPRGILGPEDIWREAERELIQELRASSQVAVPTSKPRQSRPSTPRKPKAPNQ
jgi:hypothetical protein